MWTSTRRSRAAQATRSRRVGVAVASLACVGLAACTGAEAPSPASTAEADTVAPFPESGAIDAGTYVVTGYPVPFEITVSDGWETFDGTALGKDDPDHPNSWNVAVAFWAANYVPTDACAWRGKLIQIGPTAEALVDAMTAQTSAVTTPPVEVVVGDYSGFEFDYTVASDVDVAGCDDGKFCVNSDSAEDCNARAYDTADEREIYLVVDLDTERAEIQVLHSPKSIDPALIEEARAIFDSIEFLGPDE
jgi:hypothetical protein